VIFLLGFGAGAAALASWQGAGNQMPHPLTVRLADEAAILRSVDALDIAVDAKDWDRVVNQLMPEVTVDFAALSGEPRTTMQATALVDAWKQTLFAEKKSFHMRTNHEWRMEGGTAIVTSHGYAWNQLASLAPADLWEVWGAYEHVLQRQADGWRISAIRFTPSHERGNPAVRSATAP
jgi:ketosteroid isomerase-like protein